MTATLLASIGAAQADDLRIAVASNFAETLSVITEQFEATTGHRIILSAASSGKHYAQIHHGAPFDIFFSADIERAKRLEQSGLSIANTRFTYAIGKLVLWTAETNETISGDTLKHKNFRHLAIANPKLAPYGIAAQQSLQSLGLWNKLKSQLVRGENIAQTLQYVSSGNAELGFLSLSQLKSENHNLSGSHWLVPQSLYIPIKQQLILLKDTQAARDFLTFMRSKKVLKIIRHYGYDTP